MKTSDKNLSGRIILILFLTIGFFLYRDFGISWDEQAQLNTGTVSYNYVFNHDKELLTWTDRDYGVAFELTLVIIEKILDLKDNKEIFLCRHLCTHLFFLLGAWYIFLLIKLLFKENWIALAGMLLYLLHPRIYADSFYNTKDIPFLSLYTICLYWSAKAFLTKAKSHFAILGICTGLLINIRIMGILLLLSVLIFFIIDLGSKLMEKKNIAKITVRLIVFLISSVLALYISWPYLWVNPVHNFISAFLSMSVFRWEFGVLFAGDIVPSTALPWYYAPYWIGITTPIIILIMTIAGIVISVSMLLKNRFRYLRNCPERNIVLALISIFTPLVAIVFLKSVLYDSWRQLFFLYPSLVMTTIYGIHFLHQYLGNKIVRNIAMPLICAQVVIIFNFYPHPNVYFNKLISHKTEAVRHNYEMDYWGLSYKQSLEYILSHDTAQQITVAGNTWPCEKNLNVFFANSRLKYAENDSSAEYYITNYRGHRDDYYNYQGKEFHSIILNNSKINTIFKLK